MSPYYTNSGFLGDEIEFFNKVKQKKAAVFFHILPLLFSQKQLF